MSIDLKSLLDENGSYAFARGRNGQTVLFTLAGGGKAVLHVSNDYAWEIRVGIGKNEIHAGEQFKKTPDSIERTKKILQKIIDIFTNYPVRVVLERTWPFTHKLLQVYKEGEWKNLLETRFVPKAD
jgi:hypothetical protein